MFKLNKIFKSILIVVLALILLLIIIWQIDRIFFNPYIPDFDLQIQNDITTFKFTVPKDEAGCASMSGVWKKLGPRPTEECNLPTTDAGKKCRSSKECEGVCLAKLTKDQMRKGMSGRKFKTLGQCSEWIKVLGCQAFVYQGWAKVVCVD